MPEQFFSQHALYWVAAFVLMFAAAKLLVAKHSRFQSWSDAQKSVAVKGIALSSFVLVYFVVTLLVLG